MAYNDEQILRDVDGNPIPQYWDGTQFQPMTNHIQLIKTRAKEGQFTQADLDTNNVQTFTETMKGLVITNDGSNDLTVTVLNDSWIVRPGEVLDEEFGDFTQVTITGTSLDFRAYGKGEV